MKLTLVMYIQNLLKVFKVFTKLNILVPVIKMNIGNDESKVNQIYRNGIYMILCT
jgi:hypothetical protein